MKTNGFKALTRAVLQRFERAVEGVLEPRIFNMLNNALGVSLLATGWVSMQVLWPLGSKRNAGWTHPGHGDVRHLLLSEPTLRAAMSFILSHV